MGAPKSEPSETTTIYIHTDVRNKLASLSNVKGITPNTEIDLLCLIWRSTGIPLNYENVLKVSEILKSVCKPIQAARA